MTLIICQCQNDHKIVPDMLDEAFRCAQRSARDVVCVDDLCALAAQKSPLFQQWAAEEELTVLACYPRAVKALFAHAGAGLPPSATLVDLCTADSTLEIKGSALFIQSEPAAPQMITASAPDWQPWFPVIDYDRCKNCKQCLNFCLFGVYSQNDEEMVEVTRPQKCKTGCPACARVCPFAAIIFPKYDKSPINGDEVNEEKWRKSHAESAESLKDRLAAGNLYQMLRSRKPGHAQSTPKDLADLEKLKDQLDIPDHLFEN